MRRRHAFGWTLTLAASLALSAANAGDALKGREKEQVCGTCHGLDGLSKIPEAPNLAGQNENYIVAQLSAFRSGQRTNEMMSLVAPKLSDDDIADLAAYYAGIEIKVGKIPGE